MITTFNDLKELINFRDVSYEQFCDDISVLDIGDKSGRFVVKSSLVDFLNRVSKKDDRLKRIDTYQKRMYDILVVNAEESLKVWYDKYVDLNKPLDWYFRLPQGSCLDGDTFNGMAHSKYGRLFRNINFNEFYNTKKWYKNDSEYVFGLLKVMFEKFHIRNSLACPAFFDQICREVDAEKFWNIFMMGSNKASIFNPYTYKSILDSVFEGEVLFAPCMGWNSYQVGFYNSRFSHMISTDVIPAVVLNAKYLHKMWKFDHLNSNLFEDIKTTDFYLCPSEQLDTQHNFIEKYENTVDAVLFSPPYFDLEIYSGPDQSINNFPDYDDWLEGYWRETVRTCQAVMKDGAKFGFVISNYRNQESISKDMMEVAQAELTYLNHYTVRWGAMSGGRQAKKMKNGNFEDLWVFNK